eukprot:GGOE01060968.1.p2 GENE.GGOE01060968.1~~GGOE01060968.1.p2  ORF type:complete len:146 (-),score=34.30 GGOE01060968.1:90-527(-)
MTIWDTAGQERFQSLGTAFYRGAHACLLVFDVTQPATLDHLTIWLNEFRAQTTPHTLAVVVGNKSDLPARPLPVEEIRRACAEELSGGGEPLAYFEASAKDGTNVQAPFQHVADMLLSRNVLPLLQTAPPLSARAPKPKRKRCCG